MLSLRQKGEHTKYGDILKFNYKNVFVEYSQIMLGNMSHEVDPCGVRASLSALCH